MKKRTSISGVAMLLLLGFSLVPVPASAAPSTANPSSHQTDASGWEPLDSVEKLGNLATTTKPFGPLNVSSSTAGSAEIAQGPGVEELTLTPVPENGAEPVGKASNGHPVNVYSADNHGFVVGKNIRGTTAGFVSIKDATAPSSYQFLVGSSVQSLTLELQKDGSIWVRDANKNLVNFVQKPWARDSAGKSLPTRYTVEGSVITQTVDLADAVYPVVADPAFGCGFANCTIQFNKSETRDWATAAPPVLAALVGGCGAAGGPYAAAACGAASGAIVTSAILANNHGECVELHFAGTPPVMTWWPWNYSGGYCS